MMKPQHKLPKRHGVVGVVLREDQLLVIRRSQNVRAPGKYCFPGGHVEAGETHAEALTRELHEELGATVVSSRPLWSNVTRWNIELNWRQAFLSADSAIVPDQVEVESAQWLTIPQIRGMNGVLSSNLDFLTAMENGEFELLAAPE